MLVALQTVFGARATDSNRGSTIAQFIRSNAVNQTASIEVHMRNSSQLPWQPLLLDKKPFTSKLPPIIRLRREIVGNASGTSASSRYKLYYDDEWHKIRAEDVSALGQYFNIQVSNPCVILTQERSKKFLASGSPQHKYAFFFQATQLDKLKIKHEEGSKRVQAMNKEIAAGGESLTRMEKERDALKEWVERKKIKDEAEAAVKEMRALEAWARWKERADQRDKQQESAVGLKQEMERMKGELETLEVDNGRFEEEKRKRKEEVDGCVRAYEEVKTSVTDAARQVEAQKTKTRQAENRVDAVKKRMERSARELQRKEAEIAAIRREMEEQNAHVEQERQRQLKELEEERSRNEVVKAELMATHQSIRRQVQEMDEKLGRCRSEESASVSRMQDVESHLQRVRASQQRGGSRFGRWTAEIKAMIQRRQSAFTVPPIGPVGDYIQVGKADEAFLLAIETCIKKDGLCSYLASNLRDREQLRKLFRDVCGQNASEWPHIIVLPRRTTKQYDDPVKRGQSHEFIGQRRVLDCIQVEEPWVYNALIDQKEVELSLVFGKQGRDNHDMITAAFDVVRAMAQKPMFKGLYTETGVRVTGKGGQDGAITKHPEYRGELLGVDLKDEIVRLERKKEDTKREADHHRQQREAMAAERRNLDLALKRAKDSLTQVDVVLSELQSKVAEVEAERQGQRREEDVVHLQGEADRLHAEVGELTAQLADVQQEVQRSRDALKEREQALAAAEEAEQEANARVLEARQWVDQFASSRDELKRNIAKLQQKLKTITERHASVIAHVAAETAALLEDESQLLGQYPDVTLDNVQEAPERYAREAAKAEARLKEVMRKIAGMSAKRGRGAKEVDIDRMVFQYEQQHRACEELQEKIQRLKVDAAWLHDAMRRRRRKWAEYREELGKKLQLFYRKYLKASGWAGDLILDHDAMTLDIPRAKPIGAGQSDEPTPSPVKAPPPSSRGKKGSASDGAPSSSSSSTTMSGGEKSRITVAFLMALWQSVDCPWRAMDEFDVFQDSQNRDLSIKQLIAGASKTRSRQFFFLTPLDVKGYVSNYPGVSILRMPSIDDQQSTLRFNKQRAGAE